jgi:hypothetical protein
MYSSSFPSSTSDTYTYTYTNTCTYSPTPSFVAKTFKTLKSVPADKNKDPKEKLFLNIVQSGM